MRNYYSPRSTIVTTATGRSIGTRTLPLHRIPRGEKSIIHEADGYWVNDNGRDYVVMKIGITHSVSESAYPRTDDGKSIAIARCDYLARTRP